MQPAAPILPRPRFDDLPLAQRRLLARIQLVTWICVIVFLLLFAGLYGPLRGLVVPDWQLLVFEAGLSVVVFPMTLIHNRVVLGLAARQFRTEQRILAERDCAEAALRHQALHDPLTGLANRRLFYERVDQAINAESCQDAGISLLILDLDGLKDINDTFGHGVGDSLLRQVGKRWTSCLDSDFSAGDAMCPMLARLGGDEFAVVLPHVGDAPRALQVAEGLIKALAEPIQFEGTSISACVSIGVATAAGRGIDVDSLFRRSDHAMYQAKCSGGGLALASGSTDYPLDSTSGIDHMQVNPASDCSPGLVATMRTSRARTRPASVRNNPSLVTIG